MSREESLYTFNRWQWDFFRKDIEGDLIFSFFVVGLLPFLGWFLVTRYRWKRHGIVLWVVLCLLVGAFCTVVLLERIDKFWESTWHWR